MAYSVIFPQRIIQIPILIGPAAPDYFNQLNSYKQTGVAREGQLPSPQNIFSYH